MEASLEAAKKANAGLSVETGIKEQITGKPSTEPETSEGISSGSSGGSSSSSGSKPISKPVITDTDRRMKELYNYGQLGLMERTWFEQKVLQNIIEYERMNLTGSYTYVDDKGNSFTEEWLITNSMFIDTNSLSQDQITRIMNKYNPELIERGFDVAVYEYSRDNDINPKIVLATLKWEQGWCRNGNYEKAFGVGRAGSPESYSESEFGGIGDSIGVYIKYYKEGFEKQVSGEIKNGMIVNQDTKFVDKGSTGGTKDYVINHPESEDYFINGQKIVPVNAAMYSRLKYNPWLFYPPEGKSGSHSTKKWHDSVIYEFEEI